eukprot:346517-Chlamydomonas_euryale.AAC.1
MRRTARRLWGAPHSTQAVGCAAQHAGYSTQATHAVLLHHKAHAHEDGVTSQRVQVTQCGVKRCWATMWSQTARRRGNPLAWVPAH